MPDSIPSIDSLQSTSPQPTALTAKGPNPFDTLTCREADAPWSLREQQTTLVGKVPYASGIEPLPRKQLPGYDSGVMSLLLGVLLLVTLNFRHYTTFIKTFTQNLFSVRKRANAFDERATVSEAGVLISLIVMLCVCEGILMFDAISLHFTFSDTFTAIATLSGVAAGYYIWQLIAYNMVGYIFTTRSRRSIWVKGFNASQALLSLTLLIPAVVSLFNPQLIPLLLSLAVVLYIVARIIFIIKGFRIFYTNFFSLVYFILYLCTLEIVPLLVLYKAAIFIQ